MLDAITAFVQQLLTVGGFRYSDFPKKAYRHLLTALPEVSHTDFVPLPACLKLSKQHPGTLIIDDTQNPKYGLKDLAKTLFCPATKGYRTGYKVLLFLWHCDAGTFPIGFSLWHQGTPSLIELTKRACGYFRNRAKIKPLFCLMDGAFGDGGLLQRQDFYGWSFIVRCQKNRTLDGVSVRKKIPQGYGEAIGNLKNGVRVKVIRHQGHFLMTNRKLMPRAVMQALYKLRWAIETTFKVLKSVLKLGSCQQSQMRAQAIFVGLVLVTHSVMALVGGPFSYNHLVFVNVGHLDPENSSLKTLFGEC